MKGDGVMRGKRERGWRRVVGCGVSEVEHDKC